MGEKMQATPTKGSGEGDATGAGKDMVGESGGGAYPNPHTGKDGKDDDGFFGHGGQTDIGHYGGGDIDGKKQE